MNRNREISYYCIYCKNPIYEGEAYTVGQNGRYYHPECYNQEHSYTDDIDGTSDEREY